ncbi:MAG: hypothetical protein ACJAS4_001841 [Bacteriovoracaceae bacterium]|jgi:hypothetical protein
MKLNNIFKKPVDRQIEGVIKADDETSIQIEVEEYVLTNEVAKRLDVFLDAYNNFQGANGAWLSGFFGSGKSHLLKMLAYLLENREVNGNLVKDIFIEKCQDDADLQGKIKKSVQIPSKSILFNIDQKADIIGKDQTDALLSVFVKVFDEMCGYYGKQAYIAQFERDLDTREILEDFKNVYEEIAGKPWEKGRQQVVLEGKNVAKSYAKVSGQESAESDILKKYRSDYKLSIEDFADQINLYVNKHGDNFRLNFFVDEVGQYIADNVKLMTNLQTIAESLATKCKGRAWVIVTAQEDMNSIVGDMTKQQGNDFSKIQARFNNRMKLTSADVAEVIQRRLLNKVDSAKQELGDLYERQVNNFKTLFDFSDGSRKYKNFKSKDHFIDSYPFIPYQFDLFQSCLEQLSVHNAFEGKHTAVGERSMLGVFQQVAKQILDHDMGQLATFDLMFSGIETALKGQIQRAIIDAKKNLDNPFALKLLRALFLVKYVKEFKPTVRNLCVLMYESFEQDLPELKKNIESALGELERQTYIQRNGDLFEFLTNEEKDIEEEIKNTDIDTSSLSEELSKLLFDSIIGTRKIRFEENGHDYPFAKKLDDKVVGKDQELSVHIVTPFHDLYESEQTIISQSLGRPELLVILASDDRLVKDLMMYKKTNKFIRHNTNSVQQETISRILREKGEQNHKRYNEIEDRLKNLMSNAKMFVMGENLDVSAKDSRSRINEGFEALIKKVYPQLQMLKGTKYTESHITECLNQSNLTMFGDHMIESEHEMLSLIKRNATKGARMTIKSLVTDFRSKPYGWYDEAILCTLAKLCTRGKIDLKQDGNILEDNDLERGITNSHLHLNIIIECQDDFSASQVSQLKNFFKEFFDKPPRGQEAKALGKETADEFKNLHNELIPLFAQKELFPFVTALREPIDLINNLSKKNYSYFLTSLKEVEDKLLDFKDDLFSPIQSFMNGEQKKIYEEIRKLIQNERANFDYIDSKYLSELNNILSDPRCFNGGQIKKAKELSDQAQENIRAQIDEEKNRAKREIAALHGKIVAMEEFLTLGDLEKSEVESSFEKATHRLKEINLIARVRDSVSQFENSEYKQMLSKLTNLNRSKEEVGGGKQTPQSSENKIVSSKSIQVKYNKALLKDEADLDEYLEQLKNAFLEEIQNGKQIQI